MKPLLAATLEKLDEVEFPVYLSNKLDGVRCLINEDGVPVTRSLKKIPNRHVCEWLGKYGEEIRGFDGELIVGAPTESDCFSTTMSGVMSESGEPNFRYHVFDIWNRPDYWEGYQERLTRLIDRLANSPFGAYLNARISVVPQYRVSSVKDVTNFHIRAIADGYEGVMLRSVDGRYKFGRSTLREGILLKLKQHLDMDGRVSALIELQHNENEASTNKLGHTERGSMKAGLVPGNTLGALLVKIDWRGQERTVKVGTGLTQTQRQHIWDNSHDYIGKTVSFKYSPSVSELPRFPVFLRFKDAVLPV